MTFEKHCKLKKSGAHDQVYDKLCSVYGVAWDKDSPRLVGETLKSITEKYHEDEHLNNVPLEKWDKLATTMWVPSFVSLTERVCMQKHAATKLIRSQWGVKSPGSHYAYDVFLNGKLIDTVFTSYNDTEEMRNALIYHDNYPPDIEVRLDTNND